MSLPTPRYCPTCRQCLPGGTGAGTQLRTYGTAAMVKTILRSLDRPASTRELATLLSMATSLPYARVANRVRAALFHYPLVFRSTPLGWVLPPTVSQALTPLAPRALTSHLRRYYSPAAVAPHATLARGAILRLLRTALRPLRLRDICRALTGLQQYREQRATIYDGVNQILTRGEGTLFRRHGERGTTSWSLLPAARKAQV